ncbi:RIP metalloprotease RseP [Sphingomonas cannabina]|uniref:RIP metalloprotease RseP n=1 Tax=Sphingomonas cannabina TaxID=2899123 RepID=UPI001F321994|nr:RIP metalloprotease RseP [Sphingomonas cannabina]UIJ43879.1 RIP metalloprotease RseP [Sphingomonas cannabina]
MTETPGFLLTVAAFLLVLGPLVFVHELGHYLAGRLFGVKAEVFSIGFGREIFGVTDRRGTRWKFAWLPLGGYVKFAGDMNPASQPSAEWLQLPPAERARTFQAKPVWQRAIVVAAGPIANFVLAVLLLSGFALAYGDSRAIVGSVVPGSAAAHAGLVAGDRVTAIDGETVYGFDHLINLVAPRPGATLSVTITRDGEPFDRSIRLGRQRLRATDGQMHDFGQLGVGRAPVALIDAPARGLAQTAQIVGLMADGLGQIITGHRSVKELGGPIKIAQIAGQQLALGWLDLLYLAALISINLGFINLLPVPVLDGGHLLLYAVEAVRRRPVGPQVQEWAFRGGLAMILALMLLVTFNDLVHGLAG